MPISKIISSNMPSQSFFKSFSPSRRYPSQPAEAAVVEYPVGRLRMAVNAGDEEYPLPCVVVDRGVDLRACINTNLDIGAVAIRDYFLKNFTGCARGFVEALNGLRRSELRLRPLLLIPTFDVLGYSSKNMAELAGLLRENGFVHCWSGDADAAHTLDLFRDTDYNDFAEMYRQDPNLTTKRLMDAVFDAADLIVSRVRARGGK